MWWGNGVSERVNLLCLSLMFVCVFFPLLHRRLSRQAHRDDHRGNMSTSNISLPSKRDSKGSFFKVCVTLSSQKHPYKQSCAQHASGGDCPSLTSGFSVRWGWGSEKPVKGQTLEKIKRRMGQRRSCLSLVMSFVFL